MPLKEVVRMGTVNSTEYGKFASPSPASYMDTEWFGKVRWVYGIYEAASLATGSVINVGRLRPGERFIKGWVKCDDRSSAGTLALGITGVDTAHFMAATVFTTAGQVTAADLNWGHQNTDDADDQVIALLTATEEMTGTIEVSLLIAGR
jgi:hypothetical protein